MPTKKWTNFVKELNTEMKLRKSTIYAAGILLIFLSACKTKKSSSTANHPMQPAPTYSAIPLVSPSQNFSPVPDELFLAAIQTQDRGATLDQLKEGHAIFTTGACVNCHGTVEINRYDLTQWNLLIEDMSQRANINASQKIALRNYIYSVKLTSSK